MQAGMVAERTREADVMDELGIIRTSELLVKEHGDEASIEAAMRADEMLDRGDFDGEIFWLKVQTAIKCLFMPPEGEAIQ